jgi:hypothetical protein
LKYKWFIILAVLLAGLVTAILIYSKVVHPTLPPPSLVADYYVSEATVELADTLSPQRFRGLLMSRVMALQVAKANNLSAIRHSLMDEKGKNVAEKTYYLDKDHSVLTETRPAISRDESVVSTLTLKNQDNLVTMSFTSKDPEIPQKALQSCLQSVSDMIREPVLQLTESQRAVLHEQIAHAQDPILRGRLFEQYLRLVDQDTRARKAKYYGLIIIDPPSASEKISPKTNTGTREGRNIVKLLLAIAMYLFIAMAVAVAIEHVRKLLRSDPAKRTLIEKYGTFKRRG